MKADHNLLKGTPVHQATQLVKRLASAHEPRVHRETRDPLTSIATAAADRREREAARLLSPVSLL